MKLILPWPDAILSPNNSDDHRSKMDEAQAAKYSAFYEVVAWLQDNPTAAQIIRKTKPVAVTITLAYYPPNNRRTDWDNIVGRQKNAQDGIFMALGWDDNLITVAHVYKYPPVKDGRIDYEIFWEE